MRALTALVTLALLAFTACSDSSEPPGTTGDRYPYQPASKGSTWTYDGPVPSTLTSQGDTTINGKTYLLITNTVTPPQVFLVENGVYSIWPSTTPTPGAEEIYLKENAPVGTTWSRTKSGTLYDYTISEIGISRTVSGHTYDNVIRVHLKQTFPNPITGPIITETDRYIARGVGIIEVNYGSLAPPQVLVSYEIK